MATVTTRLGHYRRHLRRSTLALSTVAIAAGLALGGGALPSASAFAGEHRGTEMDGTVHTQALSGPYVSFKQCNLDRNAAEQIYDRTTPCFHDPQGWFFQYF
ncbi:hypothetical protein ABGB18_08600 [Nonomuraea sp. B12E4]|uniref:hypothetical protein n=1 Tax=Nonomuraea sp. B12E4 TaxID=3153564 RepID=UPI00325CA42D